MSPRILLSRMALLALGLALAACGGGGGPTFGGGISGTGKPTVTVGTITDTTTLTVAGTAFDTSATSVTIDGMAAATGDLRVGMTATVLGLEDRGVVHAETVDVEEVVKGQLQAKPDATTLVVLGQTVEVTATTVYDSGITPASPAGLVVGDLLEVYGYVRASGVVTATRIERESSLSSVELTGFAHSVDSVSQTFEIGAQVIDYAAADTSDLPGSVPQEGQYLNVHALSTPGSMGELIATEVRLEDGEDYEDNDKTEVEGYVTQMLSPTRFVVNGITVEVDDATEYDGGSAGDLEVGVLVEVEGPLSGGVLTALKVEFED